MVDGRGNHNIGGFRICIVGSPLAFSFTPSLQPYHVSLQLSSRNQQLGQAQLEEDVSEGPVDIEPWRPLWEPR